MADFDASIVAHFGGDTSGLQAAITEADANVKNLESRFKEAGITMGEAPRKFAQESMKAFDALFKAEDHLATLRARDERLPTEQRLAIARKQALGILEQISSIEGVTAEKVALTVELERKKATIFDLNQKLLRENSAEVKSQTEEVMKQGKEYKGIGGMLEQLKDGFKAMGLSLKGAGIGILVAGIVRSMSEAMKEAQKTREEFEKMGKPIDASTAAVARFGDALGGVKKGTVEAAGAVLGFLNQAGEFWGSMINRMRGITKEQEDIAQSAQRSAELLQKQADAMKAQAFDVERVRAAKKVADEAAAKAAFEAMTKEQQHQQLLEQRASLIERLSQAEGTALANTTKYQEMRVQLIELEKKVREKGGEVMQEQFEKEGKAHEEIVTLLQSTLRAQDEVVNATEEQTEEIEKQPPKVREVTDEVIKLKGAVEEMKPAVLSQTEVWDRIIGKVQTAKGEVLQLQGIIAGIATAKNFGNDASDVLEERMRRNAAQISKIQIGMQGAVSSPGADRVDRAEIARLQIENQNIKRELDLRQSVARTFQTRGREAAMQVFTGDPAAFDRFLTLAQNQDASTKLLQKDIAGIHNLLKDFLS